MERSNKTGARVGRGGLRHCSPSTARALEDQVAEAGRVSWKLSRAGWGKCFVTLVRSLGLELGSLESPFGPQAYCASLFAHLQNESNHGLSEYISPTRSCS